LAALRYRCVVVHSTALEARARARQRRLTAEERQAIAETVAAGPTFASAQSADKAGVARVHPKVVEPIVNISSVLHL